MAMSAAEIETYILEAFPDAQINLVDLAGDNDHFQVTILSDAFNGKSRVEQHKMVFSALQGNMGGKLHALSVKTGPLPAA